METKNCKGCGRVFKVAVHNKLFCSIDCQRKNYYKNTFIPEPVSPPKKCIQCNEEFIITNSFSNGRKFCGKKCRNLYHNSSKPKIGMVKANCKRCKTEFIMKHCNHLFCSKECLRDETKDMLTPEKQLSKSRKQAKKDEQNPIRKYKFYQFSASKRNHKFEITFKEFLTLWDKQCYLCGNKIDGIGIDRVDNSVGYILSNCRPCCTACNYMKRTMSVDDFFSKCSQILEFNNWGLK